MAKIIITITRPDDSVPWFEPVLSDRILHSDTIKRLNLVVEQLHTPPVSFGADENPPDNPPETLALRYQFNEKINQYSGTVESLQEYISFINRADAPQKLYNDSVGIVRTISEISE